MLNNIDFTALAKRETNARKKLRLLALAHFKDGVNKATIARMLKVSRGSINKWVALFLQNGLAGLETKRYIEHNFGVQYQKSNIYRLLHGLGFSWITSRSKHPKQSEEAQEDFKKTAN
jgi:transposase